MKPLQLNEIKQVINVPQGKENPLITNVTKNIANLNDNILVFHLNKTVEVNIDKISKCKNLYIVTDQPILKEWGPISSRFIYVNNIYQAYQDFITFYRNMFNIPVIAVTGTNGKSTVKEMIAQVLRKEYNVVANRRSRNNITYNHEHLMMFDDKTQVAVIETAVGSPGHLSTSCNVFKPTIGIITNIGVDHIASCKSPLNYLRAKGEILGGLNYKGVLIINGDDPNIRKLDLSVFKGKIIRFGLGTNNDYYAKNIKYQNQEMCFTLVHGKNEYPVFVPGLGEHTVMNAMAAIIAVSLVGMSIPEAIHYLRRFRHLKSHLTLYKGPNNCTLIDDTWHINLKGVEAALKVITELGKNKKKIVVFGRFDDYGNQMDYYYETVAKMLIDYQVDFFLSIDPNIRELGLKAVKLGFPEDRHFYCPNQTTLVTTLNYLCDDKTIVLLKEAMYHKSIKQLLPQLIIKD